MLHSTMFSIWLIPELPFQGQLQSHINELAAKYDAPTFPPHVTLFCGGTNDMDQTKVYLEKLFKNISKISLVATSVEATQEYYKTLFVQFKSDPVLVKLCDTVKQNVDPRSEYEINPHLSLFYKDMPIEEKRALTEITWTKVLDYIPPNKTLTFDTIKLMSNTEKEGPDAVKNWRILKSFNL